VVQACRQGASAVSFGPAVFAKVAAREKGPGQRLAADGTPFVLRIRAFAAPDVEATLEGVEILRNGQVVQAERCATGLTELHQLDVALTENQDAWYVVRCTERVTKPSVRFRRAWTNPIYFDTPGRLRPAPARSRVRGVLRNAAGQPLAGSVTILEPGREQREAAIGVDGRFAADLLSAGTLVFAAPGYEPLARKPFEDARVQRALGAIHAERGGSTRRQLARREVFSAWRVLLADLSGDVVLQPLGQAPPEETAPGAAPEPVPPRE
jgi:hypothetical protein